MENLYAGIKSHDEWNSQIIKQLVNMGHLPHCESFIKEDLHLKEEFLMQDYMLVY